MQIIRCPNGKKEKAEAFLDGEKITIKQVKTFAECADELEVNALKKHLGLPLTKDLRYLRKENGSWVEDVVLACEIAEEYPSFCELEIQTARFGAIRIHDAYFAHMQKPSFAEDMEKEEMLEG